MRSVARSARCTRRSSRFVVANRYAVVALAALAVVLTVPAVFRLKSEFMPPLNEGVILYMPTAPPGMSENESSVTLQAMDRELKKFPEVQSVFGKEGPRRERHRSSAARHGGGHRRAQAAERGGAKGSPGTR